MTTITYSPAFGEPPKHQPYYGANPLQATKRFFTKYATFNGRASRSEFWWPLLMIWLVTQALGIISWIFPALTIATAILSTIVFIAAITPFFAVATRRMHDVNLSGKWLWVLLGASTIGLYIGFIIIAITLFATTLMNSGPMLIAFVIGFLFIVLMLGSVSCWIAFVMLMAKPSVDEGVRFDIMRTIIPVAVPVAPAPTAPLPVYSDRP